MREQVFYEHHRLQVHLGYGLAGVGVIALLAVVMTASVLALQGHLDRLSPFLSAIGPYLIPIITAALGYAFGRRSNRPAIAWSQRAGFDPDRYGIHPDDSV